MHFTAGFLLGAGLTLLGVAAALVWKIGDI